MPLASMLSTVRKAQQERWAVPMFDVFETLGVEGILEAAEGRKSPVIIALYANAVDQPNARAFAAYIRERAEASPCPVSLLLDHGPGVSQCEKAISFGFTDVMFDGSRLSIEENIESTRRVARSAHEKGLSVESEIGMVGSGADYQEIAAARKGFTDPDVARSFAEETGTDLLAVAFGSAHGAYKGTPKLDIDLLKSIRDKVSVPLVLHGGSYTPDDQVREAIREGICKVNISTDLVRKAADSVGRAAADPKASLFAYLKAIRESYRQGSAGYMDLFGSSGRAAL